MYQGNSLTVDLLNSAMKGGGKLAYKKQEMSNVRPLIKKPCAHNTVT